MARLYSRLAGEPGPDLLGGRDQVPQGGLGLGVAAGLQGTTAHAQPQAGAPDGTA